MTSKQTGRGGSSHTPQEGGKALQATGQEKDNRVEENTERILAALTAQSETLKAQSETLKAQSEEIKNFGVKVQSLEDLIQKKHDETAKEIDRVANVLSEALLVVDDKVEEAVNNNNKLDVKIKQMDLKVDNAENFALKLEDQITMLQFRSMECAVRLRGIQEVIREDLIGICSKALAKWLGIQEEQVAYRIAKIYRANSWYARQKKLPRDVVIYFTDTGIKNEIIAKSFVAVLEIQGKEIRIFKELPPRMLRLRKEFQFLVVELRKQSILYRWEAPVGISFNYNGQFHRLTTLEKARTFYSEVWKGNNNASSSLEGSLKESEDKEEADLNKEFNLETQQQLAQMGGDHEVELLGAVGGEDPLMDFTPCPVLQPPKLKPKRQRQQQQKPKEPHQYDFRPGTLMQKQQMEKTTVQDSSQVETTKPQDIEAVGGARPKEDTSNLHKVLAKLRKPSDGN